MKSGSPTLEGFRAIFRQPSLGLAEISWRWSFGFAAAALAALSILAYLDTLPVTPTELFLLRTRQPALVSHAVTQILRGSGLRAMAGFIVLALGLALIWIVIASLGRAATLVALREYFQARIANGSPSGAVRHCRIRSLVGLNFLRVNTALAAALGVVGALVFAAAATPDNDSAPGLSVLIFLTIVLFVGLAASVLNWILSLASIFTVNEGKDTFGALMAAVELWRRRTGAVLAGGTWFGLAHVTAFVVATSVVAFPLALAGVLPAGVVLGGVLLVTLLYFAVVDFLYIGRLAACWYLVQEPENAPTPSRIAPAPLLPTRPPDGGTIDRNELILSDVPGT